MRKSVGCISKRGSKKQTPLQAFRYDCTVDQKQNFDVIGTKRDYIPKLDFGPCVYDFLGVSL